MQEIKLLTTQSGDAITTVQEHFGKTYKLCQSPNHRRGDILKQRFLHAEGLRLAAMDAEGTTVLHYRVIARVHSNTVRASLRRLYPRTGALARLPLAKGTWYEVLCD